MLEVKIWFCVPHNLLINNPSIGQQVCIWIVTGWQLQRPIDLMPTPTDIKSNQEAEELAERIQAIHDEVLFFAIIITEGLQTAMSHEQYKA